MNGLLFVLSFFNEATNQVRPIYKMITWSNELGVSLILCDATGVAVITMDTA